MAVEQNGVWVRWVVGIVIPIIMGFLLLNYRLDASTTDKINERLTKKSDKTECALKKQELRQDLKESEGRLREQLNRQEAKLDELLSRRCIHD